MKARQGGVIIPRKALCIKVKRVYNFILKDFLFMGGQASPIEIHI